MPRIAPYAPLMACLPLLAPLPGMATPAIDETLEHVARTGRTAASAAVVPDAAALPDVAAPPPGAGQRYGPALDEPASLGASVGSLPEAPTPARVLLGLGSVLAGSGVSGLPTGGDGSAREGDPVTEAELVPAELSSELGLPAPLELEPR